MPLIATSILSFLAGTAITTAVIGYIVTHPEVVEKWVALICEWLGHFFRGAKYISEKNDIQGKINSFVNKLNSHTTANFPKVSIRWAGKDNTDVIWEEGKVLLVVRDQKHKTKNFVNASYFFVSELLLRSSKRHLSKNQKLAVDLYATKKILEDQSPAGLEQFMRDYFVPNLDSNEKARDFIKQFTEIDRLGIFFPVLIQEITFLGSRFFLEKPRAEVIQEVNDLIKFLVHFSNREVGDTTVPDTFTGKYMRCGIRIVASKYSREKGNISGHVKRIHEAVRGGCSNVYVIGASDSDNKSFIKSVVDSVLIDNEGLEKIKDYDYKSEIKIAGKLTKVKTHLIHLHHPESVKHLYTPSDLEPSEETVDEGA